MNPSPATTQKYTNLSNVFKLFRGMGIRHLIVTDDKNRPLGIITRKELRAEFKPVKFAEQKKVSKKMKQVILEERKLEGMNDELEEQVRYVLESKE